MNTVRSDATMPVTTPALEAPDEVSSSDQYTLRFAGTAGRYLLDRQARGLRRLLLTTGLERMRVLDVGGGHLQVASLLLDDGHSVVVHGSTARCLERIGTLGRPVETRTGSLLALPAADREFDLVVSLRILGHMRRWRELLAEMCRVSRRFVLVEFAHAGGMQRLAAPLFGLKKRVEGDTRRYATFAVRDVVAQLALSGFRLVATDRQFVLPIVAHRLMKRPAISGYVEGLLERGGITARIGSPVMLLAARGESTAARLPGTGSADESQLR